MPYLLIVAAFVLLLILLGLAESLRHRRNLRAIAIRVHINGTRGKSSVTRLIAAGLRESGLRVCAKTTGTTACMILPDGSECPVFRLGRPNVIEQVRIVQTAASLGAEALVVECMALQPILQSLSELKLIRATHGVITNARPDHLDVMGPDAESVASALAGTVPEGGQIFTAETTHIQPLRQAAEDRGSQLIRISRKEVASVTQEEMSRFSYVEHPENVALALRVCQAVGVDRQTALLGMWRCKPDAGAMTTYRIGFFGRDLFFVNGFAANDPDSTGRIWHMAIQRFVHADRRIAIFNCRADRPDRSRLLGEACVNWEPADHYLLIGTGTYLLARSATRRGLDPRKLVLAEHWSATDVFEAVLDLAGHTTLVMGMGNIGQGGFEVVRHFRNRSIQEIQHDRHQPAGAVHRNRTGGEPAVL